MFDIVYRAFDELLSSLPEEKRATFNYQSIKNYLNTISSQMDELRDENNHLLAEVEIWRRKENDSDSFMMDTELSISQLDDSVLSNTSFTIDDLEKETNISLYDQKIDMLGSEELFGEKQPEIPEIDIKPMVNQIQGLITDNVTQQVTIDDLAKKNEALIDTFNSLFGEFDDEILDDAEVENAHLRAKLKDITKEFEQFKQNSAQATPQKNQNIDHDALNKLRIEFMVLKSKCQKYMKDYKRIKIENLRAKKFLIKVGKVNVPNLGLRELIMMYSLNLLNSSKIRFEAIFEKILKTYTDKVAEVTTRMNEMVLKYNKLILADELFFYERSGYRDSTLLINAVNCFRSVFPETFNITPYSSTDVVEKKLDDLKSSIETVFNNNNLPVPRSQSLATRISILNRSLKSSFMKENLIAN